MRQQGIRITEIATACAVLGILLSLAIPTLMRMQSHSRMESLLASARACGDELPRWISKALSNHPASSDVTVRAGSETNNARGVLEEYARFCNERYQQENPAGKSPLLVVEPTGTLPAYCRRDGRIHLIPFVDPAIEGVGAKVVVTDENGNGGLDYDGILGVFNVAPATR